MRAPKQYKPSTFITVCMALTFFFSVGTNYIGYNYIPLYISEQDFATTSTAGLALAVGSGVVIIAQIFWGWVADRARTKNSITLISTLIYGLSAIPFMFKAPSLPALLIYVSVTYFVFYSQQSLADTIVIENLNLSRMLFSALKSLASLCGLFIAAFCIFFNDLPTSNYFIIMLVGGLLACIPQFFFPRTEGHMRTAQKKVSWFTLFKIPRLRLTFIYVFFLFCFGCTLTSYTSIYISTESGLNAGISFLCGYMCVGIGTEASLLLILSKRFKYMRAYTVMLGIALVGILRGLSFFFVSSKYLLPLCGVFQGIWYALLWGYMPPFINRSVPYELKASGQSAWMMVAFGFAPLFGNLLGSTLAAMLELKYVFLVVAIGLIITMAVFYPLFLRQRKLDAMEGFSESEELCTRTA